MLRILGFMVESSGSREKPSTIVTKMKPRLNEFEEISIHEGTFV